MRRIGCDDPLPTIRVSCVIETKARRRVRPLSRVFVLRPCRIHFAKTLAGHKESTESLTQRSHNPKKKPRKTRKSRKFILFRDFRAFRGRIRQLLEIVAACVNSAREGGRETPEPHVAMTIGSLRAPAPLRDFIGFPAFFENGSETLPFSGRDSRPQSGCFLTRPSRSWPDCAVCQCRIPWRPQCGRRAVEAGSL